jgi:putative photosynthetic complex assembly protein
MSAIDRHPFPRGALLGAGALIAFALLAATAGTLRPDPAPVAIAARQSMALTFVDQPTGAVSVRDGAGAEVTTLQAGRDGFVRTVLRTLVRERRARGIGPETPFTLTRWADGGLTIEDPATGKRINLAAFGPTNRAAFERILDARPA